MDPRNQPKLFILIALLLILHSFCVKATWKATLYSTIDLERYERNSVNISGDSSTSCVNLASTNICDKYNNNCRSAVSATEIISTLGTCVRLFSSGDCSGSPLMALNNGTHCERSWGICGAKDNVKSIGGCLPNQNNISGDLIVISLQSLFSGKVSSPNYPKKYNDNSEVNWIITTVPEDKIEIKFKHFAIEPHSTCSYDNLTITEFNSQEVIFEGCGNELPPHIISRSNQILIKFRSDDSKSFKGFYFAWERCRTCESTNRTTLWPSRSTTTTTARTPAPSTIYTSDPLREALVRIGLVSFHTGENFQGDSYADNRNPGCHEMPPFFRRNVGSLNDAWKVICLHSEKNCSGESISTEYLDRNTQLTNLTSIGWKNKITSWKPISNGNTC